MGLTFALLTFCWLVVYSVAIDKFRRVFARSSVRRALDGIAGVALLGLGIRVTTTAR